MRNISMVVLLSTTLTGCKFYGYHIKRIEDQCGSIENVLWFDWDVDDIVGKCSDGSTFRIRGQAGQ